MGQLLTFRFISNVCPHFMFTVAVEQVNLSFCAVPQSERNYLKHTRSTRRIIFPTVEIYILRSFLLISPFHFLLGSVDLIRWLRLTLSPRRRPRPAATACWRCSRPN